MANFGLTATSLFEIWTPVWSSASTSHFHKGIFLFLTEWYSFPWVCFSFLFFFFFFFLSRTFFRFWFSHKQSSFHKQKASACEFCKVHGVNKIWKWHEKQAPRWADTPKILPGYLPRSKIMTPSSIINFYLKRHFS